MYRTSNGNFKRRDYRLHELLDGHTQRKTLFMIGWEYDEDVQAYIPSPVQEYPLTDYRRLNDYGYHRCGQSAC
ncbi:MAG: hypothetical protein J6I40_08015 [Mailhella sp.]|nr:hypothetical protein [Mailhella sp.]